MKKGWIHQAALLAAAGLVLWFFASNAAQNLETRKIASGFGFLWREAGFEIGETGFLAYSAADSYLRALLVGLWNTFRVAAVGVLFATLVGTLLGLARLSPNWLLAKLAASYVEVVRNVPLLVQLFFWYVLIAENLPGPREALQPLPGLFLSNRGIVFPLMDPSRPGRCDPARIAEALETFECSNTFGSPAIWRRVAPWCRAQGRWFPALKRVLVAGAPVSPELVEAIHGMLDGRGEVYTPYGATESLPVCSITGREILAVREKSEHGFGTCVGKPAPGIELAVIPVRDEPIERWDDALRCGPFQLGEVCVKGAVVTHLYASESEATRAAKIAGDEGFWHRMGDLGWIDDEGRLWFCGRKAHRLETERGTLAPVPTENIVQRHPRVRRAALVGVGPRGAQRAVLVVEPRKGELPRSKSARAALADELRAFLAAEREAAPLHAPEAIDHVLFHPAFPVDVRHNAKVKNERLQQWAEKRLA